jgi:DNA-binding NarL/FixJ family response regulator
MKTVLVIEDQAEMRENLVTILEMEGYEVLAAADGREGMEMAQADKPDLILCDVMMPKLDGHGVLRGLRADRSISGTPFIFLTARGEKQDQRQGMNLGADDYLTKPVSATDLLTAVQARLDRELTRTASLEPNFSSPAPLEQVLGLSPREAEVLLWVAQGKSNPEIAAIVGAAPNTIKVHLTHIFEKLGADNRHAATLRALEVLGRA